MSFEATLARVLDPAGIYWSDADEDACDPRDERLIELRIDVPIENAAAAISQMQSDGWHLTKQPDDPEDPQQRLYFRRRQDLLPATKIGMLTDALKIVFPIRGARLWSWIIIDDENEA